MLNIFFYLFIGHVHIGNITEYRFSIKKINILCSDHSVIYNVNGPDIDGSDKKCLKYHKTSLHHHFWLRWIHELKQTL